MDVIKQAIVDWLREILLGGIISNLSGLYDSTNTRVAEIAGQVGTTPAAWNSSIYNMIRALSDNVILPIAGVVLAQQIGAVLHFIFLTVAIWIT